MTGTRTAKLEESESVGTMVQPCSTSERTNGDERSSVDGGSKKGRFAFARGMTG